MSENGLSNFSINLLAFYHKCRSLIGYVTHYLALIIQWLIDKLDELILFIIICIEVTLFIFSLFPIPAEFSNGSEKDEG